MYATSSSSSSTYDSSGVRGRDGGVPYPVAPMGIAIREDRQPCPLSHFNGASVVGGRMLPWSTGLCHCCDDPANCLVTTFCPCITFGQIADIVNQGHPGCAVNGTIYAILMGFTGLPCLYSCFYRPRLRGQYGLEESPSTDCLVHCCCEPCALCQEYRQLKTRGFDMGIGWEANMERQKAGFTVAPPVGIMMR